MHATRVSRLSIRAESDSAVRRRVFLIEDALRTAQPRHWAQHGLCWVRRLDLGDAPAQISAVAFSALVEQRLNQIRPLIIGSAHVDEPEAEAVWFVDELAPYRMALHRYVLQLPVRSWYWARAIETACRDCAGSIPMALLHALSQGEPGDHAIACAISQAVHEHWIDPLVTHISQIDVAALSPILSTRPPASIPAPGAAAKTFDRRSLPSIWQNVLERWVGRWGREDPRSWWLTRIVHTATGVTHAADQELAAANPLLAIPNDGTAVGRTLARHVGLKPDLHATPPRPELTMQQSFAAPLPSSISTERVAAAIDVIARNTEPSRNDLSHCAGFAFTINLLQRLGLGEALVQHPDLLEAKLPIRLLDRLAQRARLSDTDPARAWYAHLQYDQPETEPTEWRHPQRWSKLFPQVAFPPSVIDAFERAAILFLRRHARISLRHLIYRAGEISLTPTHIDAVFALDQADIRIRRAGLDIDPGWVPWLKRVVHFHYREG